MLYRKFLIEAEGRMWVSIAHDGLTHSTVRRNGQPCPIHFRRIRETNPLPLFKLPSTLAWPVFPPVPVLRTTAHNISTSPKAAEVADVHASFMVFSNIVIIIMIAALISIGARHTSVLTSRSQAARSAGRIGKD